MVGVPADPRHDVGAAEPLRVLERAGGQRPAVGEIVEAHDHRRGAQIDGQAVGRAGPGAEILAVTPQVTVPTTPERRVAGGRRQRFGVGDDLQPAAPERVTEDGAGALDPGATGESEAVGQMLLLGGTGRRIVGIYGKKGADLDAIGLVEARE